MSYVHAKRKLFLCLLYFCVSAKEALLMKWFAEILFIISHCLIYRKNEKIIYKEIFLLFLFIFNSTKVTSQSLQLCAFKKQHLLFGILWADTYIILLSWQEKLTVLISEFKVFLYNIVYDGFLRIRVIKCWFKNPVFILHCYKKHISYHGSQLYKGDTIQYKYLYHSESRLLGKVIHQSTFCIQTSFVVRQHIVWAQSNELSLKAGLVDAISIVHQVCNIACSKTGEGAVSFSLYRTSTFNIWIKSYRPSYLYIYVECF